LTPAEPTIVAEMIAVHGKPVEIGGYYRPDEIMGANVLRPSKTHDSILSAF
jgi:isocitrate dehydrogenase